ncbi:RAP domain-containing protein [Pelagophyceae sp. CCMP2097]|nr:RAP domain-containing protein [Pelagophyceae sp. CCMP2097]
MNIATSFHRLGVLGRSFKFEKSSVPLLQKLVDRATLSIINESGKWSPQGLANACWGIATIGNIEAPALFEAVAAEAPKKIAMFKPQELANTIATFKPQNLANTVWAYATAGVEAPALFEAVAAEAPKKIATFNPQALANTVWAYATAGVEAPALFEVIALSIETKISEFSPDGLSQLHQASMHLRLEAPQHPLTSLLSRHEAELRAAYIREEPSPSRSQRDVSAALARIGWAHEFEHVTAEGISLDMAQPASKFAVEFDGPTHYLVGASGDVSIRALDGKSKSKQRLLRKLGWHVVHVPYFEWMKLRSSAERDAYLRGKIKT